MPTASTNSALSAYSENSELRAGFPSLRHTTLLYTLYGSSGKVPRRIPGGWSFSPRYIPFSSTNYLSIWSIHLSCYVYVYINHFCRLSIVIIFSLNCSGIKLRVQGRRELLSFQFFLVHLNNKNSTQKYPNELCFLPPRRWRKNTFSFYRWRIFFSTDRFLSPSTTLYTGGAYIFCRTCKNASSPLQKASNASG